MVMIHGYDARLKTYTYNTCLGRGKPQVLIGRGSRGRGLVGGLCPAWETGFLLAYAGQGWVSKVATSRAVVDKFTSHGIVAVSVVEASTRFIDPHSLGWSVGRASGQGFEY